MPNGSQHSEETNKFHLWPWEDEGISEAEYQYSLQGLHGFLEVDVRKLYTLEDLSAVASLVGHDLNILAIVKGEPVETLTRSELSAFETLHFIQREYVLRNFEFTGSMGNEIMITAHSGHVLLSEQKTMGISVQRTGGFQHSWHPELKIVLPSNVDIAIGMTSNVQDESIYAVDMRGGSVKEYYPTKEPGNPEIQQGFTRCLQDALRDALSVFTSST